MRMRTTVTLDDDVYELAMLYAKGRAITLGAALGELIRKPIEVAAPGHVSRRLMRAANGMLIARPQGRAITGETVRQAMDDDD
jgi:hypothetical protein